MLAHCERASGGETGRRHCKFGLFIKSSMAMDNDTAALLLAGVRQVADDVPGLGPHARPSQMSKRGFLVDLRDNHVRAISSQPPASHQL